MDTRIDLVIERLKDVYDPEIPVNIYDLGLIYNVDIDETNKDNIIMTPKDKLVVVQDLKGYLVAEQGNALLICKKDDQNAIRKFVNDAEMKFGELYS